MSGLLLRAISDFAVLVGQKLRFGGRSVSHFKEEVTNVFFHGQATGASLMCGRIVPLKVDTRKFFTLPIFSDSVVFL